MRVLDIGGRAVVKNWPANCTCCRDFVSLRKEPSMSRVAPLSALAVIFLSAGVAQAQYYTTYYAPTTTYYQPAADNCCCGNAAVTTTAYYAPTTTYYAPATTTYYAPATTTYY